MYSAHIRPNFDEVGIPVHPEQSFAHYSRLATYCHICLSLQRGVKPFPPDGYTNIYPLRKGLRIISMSSHVNHLFTGQEIASLDIVGSVVFWTAECILVAITPALYDSPYRSNQWLQRWLSVSYQQALWKFSRLPYRA